MITVAQEERLLILTGPIRSGKTTALTSWIEEIRHTATVSGVLAPVVAGSRRLCSIRTGICRTLDSGSQRTDLPPEGPGLTTIGPHSFLTKVFRWAQGELDGALEDPPDWIVVDEVGPLELRGEGLEPALGRVLSSPHRRTQTRVLLVVREQLVERVCDHYALPPDLVRIVTKADLQRLVP